MEVVTKSMTVWVTYGSCVRGLLPHVSVAYWFVHCTKCGEMLHGSSWKTSKKMWSHQTELLELLDICVLLAALGKSRGISGTEQMVCCNNQRALFKSGLHWRRVLVGASCVEIGQAMGNAETGLEHRPICQWIESHQNCHKLWVHLELEQ